MRMRLCLMVAVAAWSVTGFAQTTVSQSLTPDGTIHGAARLSVRPSLGPLVAGAPYSAQRVSEHVTVAADGTRFTMNNQQETVYRDSAGRTRTERPLIGSPVVADAPLLVEISDPVNNVGYTLDTQNKVAHRMVFQAQSPRSGTVGGGAFRVGGGTAQGPMVRSGEFTASVPAPAGAPNQVRPEVKQEDLGAQTVEGVMAQGRRMTQTWPAGSQGNDRPFQTVSENWYSPELKLTILSKNSDPRSGESTFKLTNIDRSEPPLTLFEPPPDYTVVDETGTFEIQWTARRP